jgi:5-methylthioribose kinase
MVLCLIRPEANGGELLDGCLKVMLEITPENALDYLRSTGRVAGAASVGVLGGGVSNLVLRVTTEQGLMVLKQSRPQLRTRENWFSDLERIYREQEVMEALYPLLPAGVVPRVLFVDRPNFLFAMSHAPLEAQVWKADLLAGNIDVGLGRRVGGVLGTIHEMSARLVEQFDSFRDPHLFDQLRIDPFYRRLRARLPEVAAPLDDLIKQMLTRHEALCHGDYTPKNMLVYDLPSPLGGEGPVVRGKQFTLVDYETAYQGDPAMDLGLFLAHLILKARRRPDQRDEYQELMRAFWQGYCAMVHFRPAEELQARAIPHLGACLLTRIAGTSPVDYLPEEAKRAQVHELGRTLLLEKITKWSDVENLSLNSPR